MKKRFHNQVKIVEYITSTERYKAIFFITTILALYGGIVLGAGSDNFIDSFLTPFQFHIFNIILFALMFLNTINTCHIFSNHFDFYVIRLKCKKEYIKELLKSVLLVNLFTLTILFLFYLMILNVFKLGNINIHEYLYGINNLVYLLFYMIRYIIILLLITSISSLIYVNFKARITLFLDSCFLAGFLVMNVSRESVSNFSIMPWSYFGNTIYQTFSLDILYSLLFVIILEIIVYVVYKFTLKNKRVIIL